mmetsp:Transcript_93339/g.302007  ORF Transcript_93339/g.302007 Transcript_93339/m.302007 type:complete len:229 (+) Transcript_93339:1040-1726(+)
MVLSDGELREFVEAAARQSLARRTLALRGQLGRRLLQCCLQLSAVALRLGGLLGQALILRDEVLHVRIILLGEHVHAVPPVGADRSDRRLGPHLGPVRPEPAGVPGRRRGPVRRHGPAAGRGGSHRRGRAEALMHLRRQRVLLAVLDAGARGPRPGEREVLPRQRELEHVHLVLQFLILRDKHLPDARRLRQVIAQVLGPRLLDQESLPQWREALHPSAHRTGEVAMP